MLRGRIARTRDGVSQLADCAGPPQYVAAAGKQEVWQGKERGVIITTLLA
jgi:hypothetical protein